MFLGSPCKKGLLHEHSLIRGLTAVAEDAKNAMFQCVSLAIAKTHCSSEVYYGQLWSRQEVSCI